MGKFPVYYVRIGLILGLNSLFLGYRVSDLVATPHVISPGTLACQWDLLYRSLEAGPDLEGVPILDLLPASPVSAFFDAE